MSDEEVARLAGLLSAAVKFSGRTQREVERQLGWSAGSMSRLFSGGIELKAKHILDICGAIGFPPARFFRTAYPHLQESDGPDVLRIQRLLEQLYPPPEPKEPPAAAPAAPDQAEIERMVMAALGKFFSELGKSSGSTS
jgi:hypothetical protein